MRSALIKRFHRLLSNDEVHKELKRRFRLPAESLVAYITNMQEIAMQANIEEREVISLIITGLRDTSGLVSILATSTSIDALIQSVPMYERMVELTRPVPVPTSVAFSARANIPRAPNVQSSGGRRLPATKANIRCFNCSRTGHLSANCSKEKRARLLFPL